MGISINPFYFLINVKGALGRTLTLGHQDNNLPRHKIDLIQKIVHISGRELDIGSFINSKYADDFLVSLGATEVLSMDASDYEQANIVHDLNRPISIDHWNTFDTIIDGGTLEHVFHIPNALTNIARMLKVGGRFIGISPANNWLGHGFYQFSPELMWRFCKGFGFNVNRIDLYMRTGDLPQILSVPDPEVEGRRLQMTTPANLIDLMTDATKAREAYPDYIYQSDYASTWEASLSKASCSA